jgi:hypothetical protein
MHYFSISGLQLLQMDLRFSIIWLWLGISAAGATALQPCSEANGACHEVRSRISNSSEGHRRARYEFKREGAQVNRVLIQRNR